jgi:hypothetical protein
MRKPDFDPTEFIGMLSHYNFDLEDEMQQMRNQWPEVLLKRSILHGTE